MVDRYTYRFDIVSTCPNCKHQSSHQEYKTIQLHKTQIKQDRADDLCPLIVSPESKQEYEAEVLRSENGNCSVSKLATACVSSAALTTLRAGPVAAPLGCAGGMFVTAVLCDKGDKTSNVDSWVVDQGSVMPNGSYQSDPNFKPRKIDTINKKDGVVEACAKGGLSATLFSGPTRGPVAYPIGCASGVVKYGIGQTISALDLASQRIPNSPLANHQTYSGNSNGNSNEYPGHTYPGHTYSGHTYPGFIAHGKSSGAFGGASSGKSNGPSGGKSNGSSGGKSGGSGGKSNGSSGGKSGGSSGGKSGGSSGGKSGGSGGSSNGKSGGNSSGNSSRKSTSSSSRNFSHSGGHFSGFSRDDLDWFRKQRKEDLDWLIKKRREELDHQRQFKMQSFSSFKSNVSNTGKGNTGKSNTGKTSSKSSPPSSGGNFGFALTEEQHEKYRKAELAVRKHCYERANRSLEAAEPELRLQTDRFGNHHAQLNKTSNNSNK
jgi:hypothetical protein